MIKIFLFNLLLLAGTMLDAQNPASVASVFFETDRSELSAAARESLDALAPTLLQAPDYQINIQAFADDRGTAQYNLELAAERAASVQNYLAAKGLVADKSAVQNWGERKSKGTTTLSRQKSRRVDVAIQTFYFQDLLSLQNRLSANKDQVYALQEDREQTLNTAKGGLVIIPAHAFVFEDGTAPTGPVEISVLEAYDPSDFVLHNLSTISDDKILQTGGMLRISAQSAGRELQLAEGQALTISIPNGGKFDPAMELFYAQPTATGGVNWKPAGQNFRQTLKPDRIELKIDPELGRRIAAIKVPAYPKPEMPAYKGQMPPEPRMPALPYQPRAPKKPDWEATQKLFAAGGDAARLSRKELKKAALYFEEQTTHYTRDSAKYVELDARYHRNMQAYEKSKQRFKGLQRDWELELYNRLTAIRKYQQEIRMYYYAQGLQKALIAKAKTIQKYETYCSLRRSVESAADKLTDLLLIKNGLMEVSIHGKFKDNEHQVATKLFESLIGLKVIDTYSDYRNALSLTQIIDTSHRAVDRMIAETGIKTISDSLRAELGLKTIETSKSNRQSSQALQGYVATVSQLGWINCDRFYNDPAEKMQVIVQENEEANLFAICSEINAMLPFQRNSDGTYRVYGLPKGKKITIVGIKIKDGMSTYAQRELKVGDTETALNYRSILLRDLKEELKKLNG